MISCSVIRQNESNGWHDDAGSLVVAAMRSSEFFGDFLKEKKKMVVVVEGVRSISYSSQNFSFWIHWSCG